MEGLGQGLFLRKIFILTKVLLLPLFQSVVAISATNYNTVSIDHYDTTSRLGRLRPLQCKILLL